MKSLPVHKNNIKRALACEDGRFLEGLEVWGVQSRLTRPSVCVTRLQNTVNVLTRIYINATRGFRALKRSNYAHAFAITNNSHGASRLEA